MNQDREVVDQVQDYLKLHIVNVVWCLEFTYRQDSLIWRFSSLHRSVNDTVDRFIPSYNVPGMTTLERPSLYRTNTSFEDDYWTTVSLHTSGTKSLCKVRYIPNRIPKIRRRIYWVILSGVYKGFYFRT